MEQEYQLRIQRAIQFIKTVIIPKLEKNEDLWYYENNIKTLERILDGTYVKECM